jgi:hypothetical protein
MAPKSWPRTTSHKRTRTTDAASQQRVSALLTHGADVGALGLVHHHTCADATKLAAALEIGLHDGRNLLGGSFFTAQRGKGNRHLGQAHTRDFDTELRPGWQGQQAGGQKPK